MTTLLETIKTTVDVKRRSEKAFTLKYYLHDGVMFTLHFNVDDVFTGKTPLPFEGYGSKINSETYETETVYIDENTAIDLWAALNNTTSREITL